MAEKLGLDVEKDVAPRLRVALHDVYKAFNIARETGYQLSVNVPIIDIEACYRIYYYDGTLVEFIDLFRACERIINERHTNSDRNKDRPNGS